MTKFSLTILTLTTSLFFVGCNNSDKSTPATTEQTVSTLTASEKQEIEKEISARLDEVIAGAKKLDVEAAAKPYSNDPDFKIVNPDGTVTDFPTMKNSQKEGFKGLDSMNFHTTKTEYTFLTKDIVICTWIGNNDFQLKSGDKMKIDPYVGTLVFVKKNNEWKIIYAHETTGQPVKVEPKK
jgi:hypothetical protein